MYRSTKVIDGLTVCFRQFEAETKCKFLHGYALKFKITFESENLDSNNWVVDFGFLKSSVRGGNKTFKEWFSEFFDHTTLISNKDPELETFQMLHRKKIIDILVLTDVSCERFAEFVFNFLNKRMNLITKNDSCRLVSVECIENEKNSAIYVG